MGSVLRKRRWLGSDHLEVERKVLAIERSIAREESVEEVKVQSTNIMLHLIHLGLRVKVIRGEAGV